MMLTLLLLLLSSYKPLRYIPHQQSRNYQSIGSLEDASSPGMFVKLWLPASISQMMKLSPSNLYYNMRFGLRLFFFFFMFVFKSNCSINDCHNGDAFEQVPMAAVA